jgi:MFS family permease
MQEPDAQQNEHSPGRIVHARDWNGPNDPDNPRNFGLIRRTFSTVVIIFLAFVSTFGASIYSAGIARVIDDFNVSEELAILPLSLYTVGLAIGPLFGSPLCETLGRKVVFLTATPIFALFTLGAGFSQDIATLNVCRFFAGLFAAPAVGNASATIIDYTAGRYRAITMAFYYSIPQLGAVCGPLIGGFAVKGEGWRWTQWTIIFFIIAFYIPVFFTRETYKKIILQRRAKKLNIAGPPHDDLSVLDFIRHFARTQLFRPLHMLLTEPIVTLVCIYNGFLFGLLYLFIVASPWVYEHTYNFGITGQSLSFLGLLVGTAIAPFPLIAIDHYLYQPRLKKFTQDHPLEERFPPENRLLGAMIASFIQPVSLLGFAWTARPDIHWIVPMMFQSLAMVASIMIYAPVSLFMMDTYGPLYGASAAGAAMMSRYALSAAFPLFALQAYRALGVGWATSLLAFCTLAMAPIPFLFWKCGERLRGKTKYETSA